MNKIIIIIFLLPTIIFSQSSNLLKLKSNLKVEPNSIQSLINTNVENTFHKKSAGLAILYSLLLPGMGELYAGSFSKGKLFTIADGVLWAAYIGVNSNANFKRDKYVDFAVVRGGVSKENKGDTYYSIIGNYLNIDDYNNQKALERNFGAMFDKSKYNWNWQNDETRKSYRNLWSSSEGSFNNLKFIAGALIINRLASVVNAVRLVAAYNKKEEVSWNLSFGINRQFTLPRSLTLNFRSNL